MNAVKGFALVTLAMLTACGGGGGGSTQPPTPDVFSGQVFDAAIANAKVTVRTFDGTVLASTTTASDGTYTVSVPKGHDYLFIEVGEGSYFEQATGNQIHLAGETLSAVVDVKGGQRTANVNFLTHLQAGYFIYRRDVVFSGSAAIPNALNEAKQALPAYVQFDPSDTVFLDLAQVSSFTEVGEAAKASLFSAGISQLVQNRILADGYSGMQSGSAYTSIALAQLMYQDIVHDGRLNGQGETGQLTFGAMNIETNTYRDVLALAIIGFIQSPQNQSDLSILDVLPYASHLSEVTGNETLSMMGSQSPSPLSTIEPTISNLVPQDDSPVFGTVQFTFDAVDFAGIKKIEFTFGDESPETTSNFENPLFEVDTTAFADGTYDVTIEVTNLTDGVATLTSQVIVSNDGTTISNLDPEQDQILRGTYLFKADMYDPIGITYRYFYIDDVQQTGLTQTGTGYSKSINTTTLADGVHEFRVYAQNTVAAETEESVTFSVDNTAPVIENYPVETGDFLEGTILFEPTITDMSGVATVVLSVDGAQLTTTLHSASYNLDSTGYAEGEHTVRLVATDVVGNSTTIEDTLFVDNLPPIVSIISPYDGATATSQFTVFWQVDDEGVTDLENSNPDCGWHADWDGTEYPGCTYLYVGGTIYAASFLQEDGQYPININNRPAGWNQIRIVVVDNNGTKAEDSINVNFDY